MFHFNSSIDIIAFSPLFHHSWTINIVHLSPISHYCWNVNIATSSPIFYNSSNIFNTSLIERNSFTILLLLLLFIYSTYFDWMGHPSSF
jgi:hypothetical protein